MLVNLTDILTSEGKETFVTVPLEMKSFTSKLGKFEIIEQSPVSFHFTNVNSGKAELEGSVKLVFDTFCDRCLTAVPIELNLCFERVIRSPEISESDTDSEEDSSFVDGYHFNVESFIYNEILINWPMKILCKPDCKGTCPVCGQNLNEGECGCDTFMPDPRMEAIKDIFNANKEV